MNLLKKTSFIMAAAFSLAGVSCLTSCSDSPAKMTDTETSIYKCITNNITTFYHPESVVVKGVDTSSSIAEWVKEADVYISALNGIGTTTVNSWYCCSWSSGYKISASTSSPSLDTSSNISCDAINSNIQAFLKDNGLK